MRRHPANLKHAPSVGCYLGDGGLERLCVALERALALPRFLPHTSRQPLASSFREDDSSQTSIFLYPLRHLRRKFNLGLFGWYCSSSVSGNNTCRQARAWACGRQCNLSLCHPRAALRCMRGSSSPGNAYEYFSDGLLSWIPARLYDNAAYT